MEEDQMLTRRLGGKPRRMAALAGGVTSFIDMPNTSPNVLSMDILNEKYRIASEQSLANFGFF
jgi:dihydroorotase